MTATTIALTTTPGRRSGRRSAVADLGATSGRTPEWDGEASLATRASAALYRRPRARLGFTLGPTLVWMGAVYLVSLLVLLGSSFWRLNELTSQIEHVWSLDNYRTIIESPVYLKIAWHSIRIAAAVTVADIVLALPLAYYAAKVVSDRARNALLFAIVMPLWANYLVKVFAWKTILGGGGPFTSFTALFGLNANISASDWSVTLALTYLWLPYVVLPILAAFERVPSSHLEASADLGARGSMTFRRVVLPSIVPGVVAASIFSFSLTLGDYITPNLVGKTYLLGNAIDALAGGTAQNRPLAAALAMIPMIVMAIYLLIARALGAFEAL